MADEQDFTKLLGITGEIAVALKKAGITTFLQIRDARDEDLHNALSAATLEDEAELLSTWPHQAKLAASNQWEALEMYQAGLKKEFKPIDRGVTPPEDERDNGANAGGPEEHGKGGNGNGYHDNGDHGNGGNGNDGGEQPMSEPVIFQDIDERNKQALKRIKDRIFVLEARKADDNDRLPPILQEELQRLQDELERWVIFDPLYRAVQKAFARTQPVGDHEDGKLPSQQGERPTAKLTDAEMIVAAVYGILEREHITDPNLGQRFSNALALARGEYEGKEQLYNNVFDVLVEEGDQSDEARDGRFVKAEQWATVVRILANEGVAATDIHLGLKTRRALASHVSADEDSAPSSFDIDLPDLEEQANVEIVEDNLHAMQAVYFAAMLEELKLFQVVDKLVELFQYGMLPLGKGRAGDILYRYMKKSVTRFSEYERRNLYARSLGFAGGEAGGNPNRDFQMLWLRFVSAVSSYSRQMQVDSLLRSNIPARVSQEQVRKSGRDLAANLSLYGYGLAYFAATEVQGQINEIISLLSDPEIKGAYGARDMWGVVDQVAALELGGARDSIRYRTMATSGAVIIRWLANNAKQLASVNISSVLDVNEIANPLPRSPGKKPTTDPLDSDLANACERWLTVTGTPEAQVESYSDAFEGPIITSQPIQIPSVARDMLSSVGISAGLGVPNGGYTANGYRNGRR